MNLSIGKRLDVTWSEAVLFILAGIIATTTIITLLGELGVIH